MCAVVGGWGLGVGGGGRCQRQHCVGWDGMLCSWGSVRGALPRRSAAVESTRALPPSLPSPSHSLPQFFAINTFSPAPRHALGRHCGVHGGQARQPLLPGGQPPHPGARCAALWLAMLRCAVPCCSPPPPHTHTPQPNHNQPTQKQIIWLLRRSTWCRRRSPTTPPFHPHPSLTCTSSSRFLSGGAHGD